MIAERSATPAFTRLAESSLSALPYLLWAAGVVAFALGIALYGRSIPLAEDWNMVAPLLGHEPNVPAWLWAQNNEHRLPIARAIYLALLELTGGDFRSGMWANLVLLGGICLAMLLVTRKLRGGGSSIYDAILPLSLLHLGHWNNIVWSWQLQFVVAFVLIGLLLLMIVAEKWPYRPSTAVLSALALVMLPLSGANGLVMTPFLAASLGAGAWLFRNLGRARWPAYVQLGGALCSMILLGLYFVGYERWETFPNPGLVPSITTAVKFMAMAFGPAGAKPSIWTAFAFAIAVLSLATITLLVLQFRSNPLDERVRIAGLLLFAFGSITLIAGIGKERAGWVPSFGMPDRYALLSVPALCAMFFAWVRYGRASIREPVLAALLTVTLMALPLNIRAGLDWRNWYDEGMAKLERDLARGATLSEILDRHTSFLLHWDRDALAGRIRMLAAANMSPWSAITDMNRSDNEVQAGPR